jgi:CRP/FNR family transcriptional regulator, cyclic AMP receptor protein
MQHPPSEFSYRLEQQLTAWNLPAQLATEIEHGLTPVTYEEGAIIFLRDSPAEFVFWLLKGFVKVYLPHASGNRILVTIARPGQPVGMVANVDADGRSHQVFEAQALTKCSIGLSSRAHMMTLLRRLDHESMIQLLHNLYTTSSAMCERYIGFLALSLRERLEIVFKDLGARFGIDDRRGTLIILELNHEDLAEMIGSSRPMVSKVVGDMVREGLLARCAKHRFILLDNRQKSKSTLAAATIRSPSHAGATRAPTVQSSER